MNFRVLIVILIFGSQFIYAQNEGCDSYFPIQKGTKWEYQEMDKKGEISGYTTTIVEDVKVNGNVIEYTLKAIVDGPKRKEKNHYERTMTYTCEDGVLKIDLQSLIPDETMEGMESMEVEMTQTEIIIPKVLNEGDALNDGNVHMVASSNGFQVMDMNIDITNRKVEKIEPVSSPAGEYTCALISSTTSTKMAFMNTTSTSKDWYSPEVGVVKSETYDKNGNLSSSRILISYTK